MPAVYVTSLPTVATMIGANRIVRGPAITHPFGLDEDERRRDRRARRWSMLETDVEPNTVRRSNDAAVHGCSLVLAHVPDLVRHGSKPRRGRRRRR